MITVDDLVPFARGGTAELYSARAGGARVVVKLVREDRQHTAGALAAEAAVLEQLEQRGSTTAPRLLGRTRLRERDALVLEYLAMPTLRAAPPPAADRLPTALAVCEAVARVHAAGFVHADLTPDNILIDPSTRTARLIDFGVAAAIGAPLAPLATIGYAAPERLSAACLADPTLDVYALGVICFELLTGAAPFDGTPGERRVSHAARRIPRVSERTPVPTAIDDAIARAMAKSPRSRPANAGELARLLAAAHTAPFVRCPDALLAPAAREISTVRCPDVLLASAAQEISTVRCPDVPLAPVAQEISIVRCTDAPPAPAQGRSRPAMLVGFRWAVSAPVIRNLTARDGAVIAYTEGDRHVAAVWSVDARVCAERLAAALERTGASEIDIAAADIQIGASGVPRGAAIVALGRRRSPAVPRRTAPARAPLVGRDDALAAIAGAAQAARAGGTGLVTVWGPPGMGKSRLAEAIVDQLRADFELIEVRAPSVAALLDCAARIDNIGGVGSHVADRAALAAVAGRGSVSGSAAEQLAPAPGALRQAAARALAVALAPGWGERPRAILVDDAHAADPTVLDAIELATMAPVGRLLVIALARPALAATRPRWGRRAAVGEVVALGPLDREQGRRLVRALLPAVAAVPSAAVDRLVERCGGIPLYVTELVGALQRADRARGAESSATRGAVPTDLIELPTDHGIVAWAVADELAGLSDDACAAVEALALAGRDVAAGEVAPLFEALDAGGIRIELDPGVAVADLVARGLVVEAAGALRLRHDLVRDAIAERIAAPRRAAIHRAMLGLATAPAEQARHAEGAGDRAAAGAAWRAAAASALARHDDLAAETALGRALACGDAPDAGLLRQRGGARARLGRHDAAAADFAAARALARGAGDRGAAIDVLLDEAIALDWSLRHAASAARTAEAAALAGDDEPPLRCARLAMARARVAWRGGDAAGAIEPCRRAIVLADAAGAEGYETAIACRLMLGFILGGRGETDAAARILDEALAEATARGDLQHAAAARCNRYPVHAARGDAAALRADLAAFAAAGRELGVAVTEYRGALYQAFVELWCDDDAAALAHARAAHRLEDADPELFPRPCAALVLAELAARRGDATAAAAWCDAARPRITAGTAAAIDAVMLDGLTAWLAGALDLPAAAALADRAIATGEPEAAFQLLELAARAAAHRGDPTGAAAAHRAARAVPKLPRFIAGVGAP